MGELAKSAFAYALRVLAFPSLLRARTCTRGPFRALSPTRARARKRRAYANHTVSSIDEEGARRARGSLLSTWVSWPSPRSRTPCVYWRFLPFSVRGLVLVVPSVLSPQLAPAPVNAARMRTIPSAPSTKKERGA